MNIYHNIEYNKQDFYNGDMMVNDSMKNGILSFIIPGLGQFLNGDQNKAIVMFVIFLLMNLFAYFFLNNPLGHLINIGYHGYCGFDAYKFS